MTEMPMIVRLIDARVPLANMSIILGVDEVTLAADLIPAACAEHGRCDTPLSRAEIAARAQTRRDRLAAFPKSERAREQALNVV